MVKSITLKRMIPRASVVLCDCICSSLKKDLAVYYSTHLYGFSILPIVITMMYSTLLVLLCTLPDLFDILHL